MASLREQNEELKRRLEEAEETLRAIRAGEVDSLVVDGPDGLRVYALEGVNNSYRVFLEAMSEGAASLNDAGTILYCNSRFADMVGAPLAQVMGGTIHDFIPFTRRPDLDALLLKAHAGESHGEVPVKARDGSEVPAFLSISIIEDGGHRVFCLLAADLREQKRNEEIVASEGLLRSVIDQAADAIVVCDEGGRIIRASQAATRMCGTHPLLRPFDEVFAIEIAPDAGRLTDLSKYEGGVAAATLRGALGCTAPAKVRRPDGTAADVLLSATAIRGVGDKILGAVISLTDVTESKRAEEALRESETRFRSVLESSLDAAFRHDLRAGKMEYVSPTIRLLIGFSAEELSEKGVAWLFSRVHPDDMPALQEAHEASLRTGELKADYRVRCKDETYRWFSERAVIVRDEAGEPHYRSGVIRDITERKASEEALREANLRLAEADRRKNEFLAVLSHELRNPLAPIRNSTYIVQRATPGGDQAQRAVAVIERQVAQLARLVDDLLDVTRISRNKIQLQRQELEVNELVRRTLEDHRSLFEGAQVAIDFHPAPAPVFVSADWNRLAQIVGNLLQNATKFTGSGGTTTVSVEAERETGQAVIRVSDTGVGITPDVLSRLFEPFTQADSTLDRSKGGLGLGLALVKGLVELHDGDVTVRSAGLDMGSEFAVRLPLARQSASQPGSAAASGQKARRRVLVIEDNLDAADSLREVLEFDEHEVAVAYNGPEGIDKARAFHPDIVLCDIGLPVMDGYQVARAFRADQELRGTLLVALTGYALPEDIRRAEEAGFTRHLTKPPDPDELQELLASPVADRPQPPERSEAHSSGSE